MPAKKASNLLAELQETVQDLARPVDFDALEAKGIISKAGAWYRIHKMHDLPKHASQKITELAQDSKGLKVKFDKSGRYEKLAKELGLQGAK